MRQGNIVLGVKGGDLARRLLVMDAGIDETVRDRHLPSRRQFRRRERVVDHHRNSRYGDGPPRWRFGRTE